MMGAWWTLWLLVLGTTFSLTAETAPAKAAALEAPAPAATATQSPTPTVAPTNTPSTNPDLPSSSQLSAQTGSFSDIQMRMITKKEISIDPGRTFDLRFWMRAQTEMTTLTPSVKLPKGWSSTGIDKDIPLDPQRSQLWLSYITIPYDERAGVYPVEFRMEDKSHGEDRVFLLMVEVKAKHDVSVETSQFMPFTEVGKWTEVPLVLVNEGNVDETLTLSVRQSLKSEIEFEEDQLTLKSGESRNITLRFKCVQDLRRSSGIILDVQVKNLEAQQLSRKAIALDVFPSEDRNLSAGDQLSSEISYALASDGVNEDWLWVWKGSGTLDMERKRKVDFHVQYPYSEDSQLIDSAFKLHFTLEEPRWKLDIGDNSYRMSNIINSGKEARGFQLSGFSENWESTFYFARDWDYLLRHNLGQAYEIGASFGVFKPSKWFARFEVAQKGNQTSGVDNQSIFGTFFKYITQNLGTFELNYGWSPRYPQAQQAPGNITQMKWEAPDILPFSFSVSRDYAGPDYLGSVNDANNLLVNASGTLASFGWNLSFSRTEGNIWKREDASAERSDTITGSLSKTFSHILSGSFGAHYRIKHDQKNPATSNEWFAMLRPALTYKAGKWLVRAGMDISRIEDHIAQTKRFPMRNHKIDVSYKPGTSGRVYFNSTFGTLPFDSSLERNITLESGFSWRFGTHGDVTGSYRQQNKGGKRTLDYKASVRWKPFRGHKLSVNTSLTQFRRTEQKDDYRLFATYGVRFGIPLKPAFHAGVTGRIMVEEKDPTIKAELDRLLTDRLVVRVGGARVLSDDQGFYKMRGVEPSEQVLWLENKPVELIEKEVFPKKIVVEKDSIIEQNIVLVREGNLLGKILFYQFEEKKSALTGVVKDGEDQEAQDPKAAGSGSVETAPSLVGPPLPVEEKKEEPEDFKIELAGGVAHASVIITRVGTTETYGAVTNMDGEFHFSKIRPGQWLVEVIKADLPPNYKTENFTSTVDIQPGESKEVIMKAVPKIRRIRFVN